MSSGIQKVREGWGGKPRPKNKQRQIPFGASAKQRFDDKAYVSPCGRLCYDTTKCSLSKTCDLGTVLQYKNRFKNPSSPFATFADRFPRPQTYGEEPDMWMPSNNLYEECLKSMQVCFPFRSKVKRWEHEKVKIDRGPPPPTPRPELRNTKKVIAGPKPNPLHRTIQGVLNGSNNYSKCAFNSTVVQHPICPPGSSGQDLRAGLFASEHFRNTNFGSGPDIGPDKYDTQECITAIKPTKSSPDSMFKSKVVPGQIFDRPEDWRTNNFKHEDWTNTRSLNAREYNRRIKSPMVSTTKRFDSAKPLTDCMYTLDPNGVDKPRTNWAPTSMFQSKSPQMGPTPKAATDQFYDVDWERFERGGRPFSLTKAERVYQVESPAFKDKRKRWD